ncbi:MAG: methanogenesis marker 6 protein [Methanomassiliicoccaceae archaeon]|jgi:putative methanogenesis marker protein 6|nr:methanogenesis marker 6 protein [Methanomassiliicoccaceae archaeon]
MSAERETRIIVISPASDITPDQVTRTIHSMGRKVTVKESCYGAVLEGERDVVREVIAEIRKLDANGIFTKVRAYHAGDPRRCRAHHGTRPGFAQLEQEWGDLWKIQHGLDCADRGEKANERKTEEKLSVERFKKICEVK